MHWQKLDVAFVALKCGKYQFSRLFFSLMRAAKAQASLCISKNSTEPSFLENAITVHCEIFQIKHWNISNREKRTFF